MICIAGASSRIYAANSLGKSQLDKITDLVYCEPGFSLTITQHTIKRKFSTQKRSEASHNLRYNKHKKLEKNE